MLPYQGWCLIDSASGRSQSRVHRGAENGISRVRKGPVGRASSSLDKNSRFRGLPSQLTVLSSRPGRSSQMYFPCSSIDQSSRLHWWFCQGRFVSASADQIAERPAIAPRKRKFYLSSQRGHSRDLGTIYLPVPQKQNRPKHPRLLSIPRRERQLR